MRPWHVWDLDAIYWFILKGLLSQRLGSWIHIIFFVQSKQKFTGYLHLVYYWIGNSRISKEIKWFKDHCVQHMTIILSIYWLLKTIMRWYTFTENCQVVHITTTMVVFNTLRPRQNGRHFADDNFKLIFVNENVRISIKISLKFVS